MWKSWWHRWVAPHWRIGFLQNTLEEVIAGAEPEVRWMIHQHRGGWFADTFVLDVTDTTISLLAEEFRFKTGKGRIVRLDVERETFELEKLTVLIDDCHLSFPFVLLPTEGSKAVGERQLGASYGLSGHDFCRDSAKQASLMAFTAPNYVLSGHDFCRDSAKLMQASLALAAPKIQSSECNDAFLFGGEQRRLRDVMIFPETGKEGQWRCYRLDLETNECVMDHVVCEEPLVDAVIYENSVFATTISDPNGKNLSIYELCENSFQLVRTITFDEKVARNAGAFFKIGEKVYRPAQECNEWYGHALSIQEFKNGEFKEVRRIPGFHTLNSYQGVTVVDAKQFPRQWVYKMIRKSDL